MSQSVHLIAKSIPGFVPTETRFLPCSGVSGTAVTISPYSARCDCRISLQFKIESTKYASRAASFVCRTGSGGHRRNPDFGRQNKQSFSRNRGRQKEERDSFEHLDESDMLTSKNGPALSLSSTSKFQATASPGPREKEIVELFRKVQAQLRERAAAKEEKKVEASKGKSKESETVDSLLKLLRKHSIQQGGRKKNTSISDGDFVPDQPERNAAYNEDKGTSFFNSNSKGNSNGKGRSDVLEPSASSFSRPPSSFRRKSPVPQVKFQPVYSSEDNNNSASHLDVGGESEKQFEILTEATQEPVLLDPELEAEEESESEEEPEPDLEASYPAEDVFDELSEGESSDIDSIDEDSLSISEDSDKQQVIEHEDMNSLKLPELRAIAKSRGVKGFSRMKKAELVELLSAGSHD